MEKHWSEMTALQKAFCYNVFADSTEDGCDTFEGFCETMSNSIFDVVTGKPVEIF